MTPGSVIGLDLSGAGIVVRGLDGATSRRLTSRLQAYVSAPMDETMLRVDIHDGGEPPQRPEFGAKQMTDRPRSRSGRAMRRRGCSAC